MRAAAVCKRLSFRLVRLLAREANVKNIFISPPSLALALLMVQSGATGDTRTEIVTALGLEDLDHSAITRVGAFLNNTLQVSEFQARLAVANGLWVNADVCLSGAFTEFVRKFYAAQARVVDFSSPQAVEAVNQWVSQVTGGQIISLLTDADLASATDCVLASAIWFKGLWQTPFDPELTKRQSFALANGADKTMPFMSRSGPCLYYATEEFQAVSLPYGGDRFSMEVLLPSAGRAPEKLLAALDSGLWEDCLAQLEQVELRLELPRFRLAYEAEMRRPFSPLGIRRAFGPEAEFSPMGLDGHFIGIFKHAAEVDVSEEGTQAVATTAAGLIRTASRPVSMRVDRPFFCAIRERVTGCLLFTGIVAEPT